jgi:hypothetical protein
MNKEALMYIFTSHNWMGDVDEVVAVEAKTEQDAIDLFAQNEKTALLDGELNDEIWIVRKVDRVISEQL